MDLEVLAPLINFYKVKYDILEDLIKSSNAKGNNMNIYINLESIFNGFYDESNEAVLNSLTVKQYMLLVPHLINLAAHYRHFFWSRFRAKTKIYFYYCNKVPKWQKNKLEDYYNILKDRKDKYITINDMIKNVLKAFDKIIPYITDVFYIPSNGLDPSVIPYYLIKNSDEDYCNLIITKDKFEYQLCNLDNTFILSPRGKNTKFISKEDIFDHKLKNMKYKPKHLDSSLYSLIITLVGYKDRNIPKILTFGKVIKKIDILYDNNYIENKNSLITLIKDELLDVDLYDKFDINYKISDIKNSYKLLTEKDIYNINKYLVNKYHNESIMVLNGTYFADCNIQLVELAEGIDR